MTEDIIKMLELPEEAESILITSLKKLSEDDGQGNSIEIENEWMAQRFVEAGLSDADKILYKDYPVKMNEYVVHSPEMAICMNWIKMQLLKITGIHLLKKLKIWEFQKNWVNLWAKTRFPNSVRIMEH